MQYDKTVWQLLRKNISRGQMLGYALANVVGLSVVLIGLLFYGDSQNDNATEDRYFSQDYVVLSKKVEGIGFTAQTFTDDEIAQLEHQPWAKKVGRFTASQFAAKGSVVIGGKELSTYLFVESVPDEFFDIKPRDWHFRPGDRRVPVVLSKDYLTLYNYGFAIPQGLPQLSEEIIGSLPLNLRLTGEDMKEEYLEATIVGFSSRLGTIAVPQSFMEWANAHYAKTESQGTSRLIVETNPLASSDMSDYLKAHNIESSADTSDAGNIARFLGLVSGVVGAGGLTICLLALFILVLSLFLLLQKSRHTLRGLMLLGYHPREIGRYYALIVVATNIITLILALSAALLCRPFWDQGLVDIGLGQGAVWPMFTFAFVYMALATAFDLFIIRRRLDEIWKKG